MLQLFWRVILYSWVVKTHSGNSFPLVHINVCDLFLHVSIWHGWEWAASTFVFARVVILIKDELGIAQGVCMIQWSEFGTAPQSLLCFSADGQWQRCLYLCPRWEWKMGIGHALVCEAEPQDMSLHATESFSPTLIRKFLPITFQCLRAGMPRAVSISHPASIPGLFSLCWITGVSSRPTQP